MRDLVSSCKYQIRSKFQGRNVRLSLQIYKWFVGDSDPKLRDWGMRRCTGRSFLCTCFSRITAGSRAQLRRTWVELSILWRNCIHGEDRGHHVGRRSYQKASMLTATRKRIISYFGEGNEAIAEAFKTQSPLQHCSILRSCTGDEVLPSQRQLWSSRTTASHCLCRAEYESLKAKTLSHVSWELTDFVVAPCGGVFTYRLCLKTTTECACRTLRHLSSLNNARGYRDGDESPQVYYIWFEREGIFFMSYRKG